MSGRSSCDLSLRATRCKQGRVVAGYNDVNQSCQRSGI